MRSVLCDRQILGFRLTVDGAGRREDDSANVVLGHEFEQIHQRDDVVAIVEQRLLNALADGLRSSEVDDALDVGIFLEYAFCSFLVAKIHILKGRTNARDLLYSVEHFYLGVGQVVDDDDFIAGLNEFNTGMGTNKTCSSSNKNCLFHNNNIVD